MVPGHDGKRGYGGTCFPKDIKNLYHLMKENNQESYILKNVIERNETVDRSEKDWLNNKGKSSCITRIYNTYDIHIEIVELLYVY